jgi:hypothetical protein
MQTYRVIDEPVSWTREAGCLIRLARCVSRSAGMEYSLKIGRDGVDGRRFLISTVVRPDFRAALYRGLDALRFPAAHRAALDDGLARMRFLHFGYGEPGGAPVVKLYCEVAPEKGTRVRMHESFKWRPREGSELVRDDYWALPGLDAAGLDAALAARSAGAMLAGGRNLLALGLARADAADLFFLEVLRAGRIRSCDIRLYDADLTLAEACEAVAPAAAALGVKDMAALTAGQGGSRLGHVSLGRDFFTLYYGAEDLA